VKKREVEGGIGREGKERWRRRWRRKK